MSSAAANAAANPTSATPDATTTPDATPRPNDILVVLATFPDPDKAATIARTLVEEQLAACVNLVPQIRSIYRWHGAVEDGSETLGVIKTTRTGYVALARRLVELHPYEVAEVLALPLVDGHAPYLQWVASSVR